MLIYKASSKKDIRTRGGRGSAECGPEEGRGSVECVPEEGGGLQNADQRREGACRMQTRGGRGPAECGPEEGGGLQNVDDTVKFCL